MKTYIVIALGFLLAPLTKAQIATYLFDAPCVTSCTNPGPDCPGVGNANATSFNNTVLSAAGTFTVAPSLNPGTATCISPGFSISMNGFAAGNPGNPSRARWASGWTTSVVASASQYYTTTLTAATYATVGLTQITFDESRSSTGPRNCQVMVSVDGGPFTLLWQGTIPDNTSWRNRSITTLSALAPMPTFSSTLTIIFQGFASEATSGSWRIDNVRFFAAIVNLPIELVSFTGHAKDHGVDLNWITATETINDFFTVYRLENDSTWQEIAEVPGAGNSASLLEYSTTDPQPKVGANYYKLRQTDTDGQFEEFDRVCVIWKPPDKFTVFPNPSSLDSPVFITGEFESLMVTNQAGQAVPFVLQGSTLTLRGAPGMYYLQTQDGRSLRLIITP